MANVGTHQTARAAAAEALLAEQQQARPVVSLPYPTGKDGLAGSPRRFEEAVSFVAGKLRLLDENVAHDYWLVRSLYGIHQEIPSDGRVVFPPVKPGHPERYIGTWAFGGGSALSAAWKIAERYSEDIDGLLFLSDDPEPTRRSVEKACKKAAHAVHDACEAVHHETHGRNVKVTRIDLADNANYLKLETVPQRGLPVMVEPRMVHSFIGLHGDPGLVSEFPELGGFEIPCVSPALTAVNKLDALNRRAAQGDLHGLDLRGRDLYDLWAITQHVHHADQVRESVAGLWEAAAGQLRNPVPRPSGGYSQSDAFRIGSNANEALRSGYATAIEATVWGDAPDFETAVRAAASLD